MDAYAVIETGGKQYLVRANDVVKIERLDGEPGAKIEISPVLALSDGNTLKIGTPAIDGAKVKATLVEHIRGKKVTAFKKRRRKTYSRQKGHRQELTVIKIESVS